MSDAIISRISKGNNINIVQETGTSTASVMSQNASTNSFAVKNHSHAVSDLTSGTLSVSRGGTGQSNLASGAILLGNGTNGISSTTTLPINKGGTGSSNASGARNNLGITIESGDWTPTLFARDGTSPAFSIIYRYAKYYRVNNLVHIAFHMKINISSSGSGYAGIKGLPFTSTNGSGGQALSIYEVFGGIGSTPVTVHIPDNSSQINIQNAAGETANTWKTGDTWIGLAGCYVKA